MLKVSLNQKNLERAITRRNLSEKKLAHDLEVSRCYLSRIICGEVKPSAAMRQRLLDFFKDCTFDDLFIIDEDGRDSARKA